MSVKVWRHDPADGCWSLLVRSAVVPASAREKVGRAARDDTLPKKLIRSATTASGPCLVGAPSQCSLKVKAVRVTVRRQFHLHSTARPSDLTS